MNEPRIELTKPIAEVSDAELLALMTGSAEAEKAAAPVVDDKQPEATPEGDNVAAAVNAEPEADPVEATTTEDGNVIPYDDFVKEFADKRIVMDDGTHAVKDLLTSHSYVQRKLNESRKNTEKAVADAVEPLKPKAEKFDAITQRLQIDRIGLGVDAMCIGLDDAAKAKVEAFAAQQFGWTRDGSRAIVAEARLEQVEKQPETKRTQLDAQNIRIEAELALGEFNDAQWDAIYGRAISLEQKGAKIDSALAQSVGELYPSVLAAYQAKVNKTKPAVEQKTKPKPQSLRPGAKPGPRRLDDLSDAELMAAWKQVAA